MSRKTIPFTIPPKPAEAQKPVETPVARIKASKPAAELEQWVNQTEKPLVSPLAAPTQATDDIVITLSATPNWADLVKLTTLPYTTFWAWTFGAAQKGFRGFKV
jgi:hypothetical protein